ncbi:enoyl-CoA hydratase/isomerase family protein [Streptomyces abyssomicinicus]|uniref:enoyl-CoA hydratase/isomerase family protein n=1 Tax=Streptomyces abyssomicinicus TaxID=574929 RepID=UPI00124FF35B|nr:enoyl-CoA hydratase/isomerase family protein [Streptomyces abyssomicinicus]
MSTEELVYTVEDGIATLLLNRPDQRNAFTLTMIDAWERALRTAGADPEVKVVVLTGAGEGFCAGGDMDTVGDTGASGPLEQKNTLHLRIHKVARALEDLDKPVIAAINGVAVGAGLDMALMCDIRFAARSARMSEGYIRLGLVPGDGGAYFLPRLVGQSKALELLLGGEFVDAEEALRIGMVNRVVDDADLLGETYAFAAKIAARPSLPVGMIKRAVRSSDRLDMRTSLDLISSHMAVVMSTPEAQQAIDAVRSAVVRDKGRSAAATPPEGTEARRT